MESDLRNRLFDLTTAKKFGMREENLRMLTKDITKMDSMTQKNFMSNPSRQFHRKYFLNCTVKIHASAHHNIAFFCMLAK